MPSVCGRRRRATGCHGDRPGPTARRGHRHTHGRLAPRPVGRSDSWRTLGHPRPPPVGGLRPAAPGCWRVRSGAASNRRRWYRDRSLACSRLACGLDELRRGWPPRTARSFAPALASTPALAGLWLGTCSGRVRGARPGSGRGDAVQGWRRWNAALPLRVPVHRGRFAGFAEAVATAGLPARMRAAASSSGPDSTICPAARAASA